MGPFIPITNAYHMGPCPLLAQGGEHTDQYGIIPALM